MQTYCATYSLRRSNLELPLIAFQIKDSIFLGFSQFVECIPANKKTEYPQVLNFSDNKAPILIHIYFEDDHIKISDNKKKKEDSFEIVLRNSPLILKGYDYKHVKINNPPVVIDGYIYDVYLTLGDI